ncbi:MAG: 4Fe-4S dicluster domain-containing protein [Coriobacteriales bacterium]|jgi:2-oxoglutarate ferredoxin oxidoreductase subunit delta|nr:4Fe-4S dicluster domain-containing protein [Coriobacteriales bacterium]
MAKVSVSSVFCKGCGLCVDACPETIMALDMETITDHGYHPAVCIDNDKCTGCISCATICPDVAITIER